MDYETVIGLEVHVQLATQSKLFSGAPNAFGAEPNTHVDPVTMGFPGSLPVPNHAVIEYAIKLGLALNCEIRSLNRFARKHYFYPDLPKGYQISQFEEPICERGYLPVIQGGVVRNIGITRIHMEEDAGKNIHQPALRRSLVDLNRAGVPLLEVVSQPDLRSPAEAAAYLRSLRQIVRFLGISDGNMEEGSLRCDANISLRPVGELSFGTRTEIKNMNSFRFVEKALEYETARQLKLLKNGQAVIQETRYFDPEGGGTHAMRGKEESADYRYFPDPDLPPIVIEEHWIEEIRASMPKLPAQTRRELQESFGLSEYDAEVLTAEREYLTYFEAVYQECHNAKAACNWITSEIFGYLKREDRDFSALPVKAEQVGRLIKLIDTEFISGRTAKSVFEEIAQSGEDPEALVIRKGWQQISDPAAIRAVAAEVLAANPQQVQKFLGGNDKLLGFFVGQVMKATDGNASPKVVNQALEEELAKLRR